MTGVFQLDGGPQLSLKDAKVYGADGQRYIQPQHTEQIMAHLRATAVDGATKHDIRLDLGEGFENRGNLTVLKQGENPESSQCRVKLTRQSPSN